MSNYDLIMTRLATLANDLSMSYISTLRLSSRARAINFADKIIHVLSNNKDLWSLLGDTHRQDLLDSILTHSGQYLELMSHDPSHQGQVRFFRETTNSLITMLKALSSSLLTLEASEQDELGGLIYQLAKSLQIIFAEQLSHQNSLEAFLAFAIVVNLPNLSPSDRLLLFDQLILIKALWLPDYYVNSKSESAIQAFFLNPRQAAVIKDEDKVSTIFDKITLYFIETHSVFRHLTDENLISFYDQLKDAQWENEIIKRLLGNLHQEARCRYTCNRVSDLGYQMLEKFQSFDAILSQIENTEFQIAEVYLLKHKILHQEIFASVISHSSNIQILDLAENHYFQQMLSELKICSSQDYEQIVTSLDSSALPSKKYVLDQYTQQVLQQKYQDLFQYLNKLIGRKDDYELRLNRVVANKLANDYYLPSASNSVIKLRLLARDRERIRTELLRIDFTKIYQPQYHCALAALSFKVNISENDLSLPENYVIAIIREIVRSCNILQLEQLLKLANSEQMNSSIQTSIRSQVAIQARQQISNTKQKILAMLLPRYRRISGELKRIINIAELALVSKKRS